MYLQLQQYFEDLYFTQLGFNKSRVSESQTFRMCLYMQYIHKCYALKLGNAEWSCLDTTPSRSSIGARNRVFLLQIYGT